MSRRSVSSRIRKIASGAAILAVVVFGSIPALAAPSWAVTLEPVGPTAVPQGLPVTFKATVVNNGDKATDYVVFDLSSPSQEIWAFYRIRLTLEPGESYTSDPISVTPAAMFAELGTYEVIPMVAGSAAGPAQPYEVLEPITVVPRFTDATQSAGVEAPISGFTWCSSYTAGAAWGDVEGDGDLDLYVPIRTSPSRLFINDGAGHFADEAAARGLDAQHGLGAVFIDYDNDGDADVAVSSHDGFHLYRNDGTGYFADVTSQAGVAIPGPGPQASAWGDYDRDGNLDVYVVRYQNCTTGKGLADHLFHGNGNGTFSDVSPLVEGNPGNPDDGWTFGPGFQAGWVDIDSDGDLDLYLANDRLSLAPGGNRLWRNDGPGTTRWRFTDITKSSGTGWDINSMGLGIGDYDRDLDFDFAISNMGPNVLARNNGDRTFTNVAAAARVDRPWDMAGMASMTWGLDFRDLNDDGWEDLYVLQGMDNNKAGDVMPHELFVSAADGTFFDLSAPSGAMGPGIGRGIAFADYDRDGRMDMYVLNQLVGAVLYHNETPLGSYHWLEVLLTGTTSNRDGCGARLVLTLSDMSKILRGAFCGSTSLSSGHDPAVHFGLGADSQPLQLDIYWPSGIHQTIIDPAVDQLLQVVEAP